jgi:hypothetical protein
VAGCGECVDEPPGSGTMELVRLKREYVAYIYTNTVFQ